jgi:hypothetical protein
MSPNEISETLDPFGRGCSTFPRRAGDKGFLPMSLARDLKLLD